MSPIIGVSLLPRLTRRKASAGVIFFPNRIMPAEPATKRTVAFIDGQNLFHMARQAFGYTFPNYDVQKLAAAVCRSHGWNLTGVRFYTGVPDPGDNPFWHGFWTNKLAIMGRRGVGVYSRPLVYRNKQV